MHDPTIALTLIIFFSTIAVILWKPRGLSETIPTVIGASLLLLFGIVSITDVMNIFGIVSGASITILSTIVMSIVLESIGFFRWVAINLIKKANGSGIRLYFYIILLCFLMTLFFNNDGSILITTPIIIRVVKLLRLKPHNRVPYLISGALIATAASAPIAISNIANLIALKIVGLDLNGYVAMMFVPSMVGIITMTALLYKYFKSNIPRDIPIMAFPQKGSNFNVTISHPLKTKTKTDSGEVDWWMFKICLILIVVTRGSYFVLTSFGIPMEWIAIAGALAMILFRYYRTRQGVKDVMLRTPWHILIFALGMYILVFGLRNIGIIDVFVQYLGTHVNDSYFGGIFVMGILLTVLSNVVNNLPAVMIGTLTLMEMGLDTGTLQVVYLANIIGSDIGALLTPIGTLATLIWMFLLRKNNVPISWGQYFKITLRVVPISLIVSLIALYLWNILLFL